MLIFEVTLGSRTSQENPIELDLGQSLQHHNFMHRKFHRVFLLALSLILTGGTNVYGKTVQKFVTTEEEIREQMINLSREIGVTCNECHSLQNFKDGQKKSYQVGKEHMKITQLLKENGFNGKKGPQATCFMCHRGKLKPDYIEPISNKAQ